MSDIWTIECDECLGLKGKFVYHDAPVVDDSKEWIPCPTCSGKGGWWLGVECEGKENCNKCAGTVIHPCDKKGHRILTVEEVAEYRDLMQVEYNGLINDRQLLEYITNGQGIDYKGSRVILMPREG